MTSTARTNIQSSTVLLLVINMYRQPPPSPPVPRQQRAEYVDTNRDVVEQCHICLDPFDAGHPPARFRGPDKCQHIFGAPCLREWCLTRNVNAARCPICRTELFSIEDDDDSDVDSNSGSEDEESLYEEDWDSSDEGETRSVQLAVIWPSEEYRAAQRRYVHDAGLEDVHSVTIADYEIMLNSGYVDSFVRQENDNPENPVQQLDENMRNFIRQQDQELENPYRQQDDSLDFESK